MKIGLLVENRYLSQAQPKGLAAELSANGHDVIYLDPEARTYNLAKSDWLSNLDLIVARGRSYPLLCLLGWAEAGGVRTINQKAAISSVHNKADMAVTLAQAGINTPNTFLGTIKELYQNLLPADYPIVLKPIFGDNSRGLKLINSPDEMKNTRWSEPVALAQKFLPNDGYDLKLYGIGSDVWTVRKPSPFGFEVNKLDLKKASEPELLANTHEAVTLGRKLGLLFGLELYGADCVQTPEGLSVIEVNEFPNYSGVPQADSRLAGFIINSFEEAAI